jgi:hypothetical protein
MLVRPVCSCHKRAIQAAASGCFLGSPASRAVTRTLVSTKTSAVMQFFPSRVTLSRTAQLDWWLGEKSAHRAIVLGEFVHALRQHFADQARKAGVVFGGIDARPNCRFLVEGYGDVLYARSIL